MSDEQDRHAILDLQILDQSKNLGLNRDIKGGGWFICNQQLWFVRNCQSNHHPLTLASGKLMGILIQSRFWIRDLYLLKESQGLRTSFLLRHLSMCLDAFNDLIANCVERIQAGHRLLKNHGDRASSDFL